MIVKMVQHEDKRLQKLQSFGSNVFHLSSSQKRAVMNHILIQNLS